MRSKSATAHWAAIACSSSGPPVELGEQLRPLTEARATAGGEHEATDQAGTSWIRPLRVGEPPAVAPMAGGDDLGQDRQRGLLAR